jgi:AcrR family transcriptional regulator
MKRKFKEYEMDYFSNNAVKTNEHLEVRERIMDAAEELFSEKGFSSTTVREITRKAKCNLAAINYHFQGKDNLYVEVIKRNLKILREVRIEGINKVLMDNPKNVTLEKLLKAFAESFVEPFVEKDRAQRFMKMMIHEMLEPRLPKQTFADEVAIPTINAFGNALKRIYPDISEKNIFMNVISIIGQLVHTIHLNEIFKEEINLQEQFPGMKEMMENIVKFSAAGIRATVGQKV